MVFRKGLILVGSLLFAGACASGGGATGETTTTPTMGGEVLAQGERPRETGSTRDAMAALEQAEAAETEEAARPFYQQALTAAEAAVAEDATNPLAYRLEGRAHVGLDQYEEAAAAFDRAMELRPIYELDLVPLRERIWIDLYQAAIPAVNAGDYAEAIRLFEAANTIYADRPEAMVTLGQIYAQEGEYELALQNLTGALEMIESAERTEGRDSATIATWRETAEELPLQIVQTLMNAGRNPEAIERLQVMIVEDPDDLVLAQTLANLYVRTEQLAEAAAAYERLLQRTDLNTNDYYQIGIGLYQLEDWEGAANAFGQAVEQMDRNRDAAELWARTLREVYPPSDTSEATPAQLAELESAARLWTELDPQSGNALRVLAQTVVRQGDQERARDLVTEIEDLQFTVDNLNLQRFPSGGGTISGQITNLSLEPGTPITLNFTFYGIDGSVVTTQSTTVEASAQQAAQVFQMQVDSDQRLGGYTYEVEL